jgi:hypothetical protein
MDSSPPVRFLASTWRHDDLSVVLDHLPSRYPLQSGDALNTAPVQESLSASFLYPLHNCLLGLRREMNSTTSGKKITPDTSLIRTIRVLLEHGFEPNERIDQLEGSFEGETKLSAFIGYIPIQVVASIALEFEGVSGLYVVMRSHIADAAQCLVRNGARIGVDAPPLKRLRRR